MGGSSTSEDLARRNASVQSAINRALHREGAAAKIQDLFLTRSGRYRGSTSPTSSTDQLLEHHATVIRAARMADPGVTGLEARRTWWWVKMHAILVARYLGRGSGGTEMLREELEAENVGIRTPSPIPWLRRAPSVKARHRGGTIEASLVVLAVADEDTFRLIRKGGLRLRGRRYEVGSYEEVRSVVGGGHCCEWGHIEPQCPRTAARCGWCVEGHTTKDHRCPAEGCRARKGHWCRRAVPECANCRGPHFAQANACPEKKAARGDAKGWRSPSPKWKQRGEASLPEDPPTGTQEPPGDRPEVEEEYEPASGEAMEE